MEYGTLEEERGREVKMVEGLSVQAPPACLHGLGSGQGSTRSELEEAGSIVVQVTAGYQICIFFPPIPTCF